MSSYNHIESLKTISTGRFGDAAKVDESYLVSADFAVSLDKSDDISASREEYHMPLKDVNDVNSGESVYLCGNSLGLQPKKTRPFLDAMLTDWAQRGVIGHFDSHKPWATIDDRVTGLAAEMVGAKDADEVAICNSLSTNLHLLLITFYQPQGTRTKILMEDHAFCSDNHIVWSQVKLHGLNPEDHIIRLQPRPNETYLRTEDILDVIAKEGDSIATVLLPGVQFYTGQLFDMKTITAAAKAKGCMVGYDLAHATGNVPLSLHDWDVDFAAWCHYKYCNAGPGAIAGLFVHHKHAEMDLKRLSGWWGQELKDRFGMDKQWKGKKGAQGYQLSNPPVVSVLCVEAGLKTLQDVGMEKLRSKSVVLTQYLEALIAMYLPGVEQLTPRDPNQRYVNQKKGVFFLLYSCLSSSLSYFFFFTLCSFFYLQWLPDLHPSRSRCRPHCQRPHGTWHRYR
jgi:kynureninase